ncbi:MAG: S-layer homology domain-containing protein, partial [Abditibacteriota bacterium]|nr:S-layer homology domain-containing protein [Abditibacteriota bacterium]
NSGGTRFSDVPADYWARNTIDQAFGYGWIGDYSNGTFNPSAPITRAAVTAVINRMLGRSADQQYVAAHSGELSQFTDVQDSSAWYYYNVAEAANGHSFTKSDGKESWNSVNP